MKGYLFFMGVFAISICTKAEVRYYKNTSDPGGITVSVKGKSKKCLDGFLVTSYVNSQKDQCFKTNCEGLCTIPVLKTGTYKVVIEKPGYNKVTKERVVVKTNENYMLNVELIEREDYINFPSIHKVLNIGL